MSIIIYIVVFVLSLIVEMFLICLLFSCDYKMGGVVLWMNKNICWAGCVNIRIQKEGDPKVNQIFKEITDCKFKE